MLKDRIMFTGGFGRVANRVEFIRNDNDDGTQSSRLCNTPLPVDEAYGYTTTSIQGEKVILVGGYKSDPHWISVETAFEGSLDQNQIDVDWINLPSMKKERSYHADLYLNNKLYIVGHITKGFKKPFFLFLP